MLCCALRAGKSALASVAHATLALGDTGYPHYCRAGKTLDEGLVRVGSPALLPLQLVDQEDWGVIDVRLPLPVFPHG